MAETRIDPVRLLRACFETRDWLALLSKESGAGKAAQRIGSLHWACGHRVQEWLRERNAARCSVYVSVNALVAGACLRARHEVAAVRHLFLDVDNEASMVLREIERRPEIPAPSYVVHTSAERSHLLWRVRGFEMSVAERVQRRLAIELGGDRAATSVAQLTRLPGFSNHKHDEPYMVWVEYRDVDQVYTPRDFPAAGVAGAVRPGLIPAGVSALGVDRRAERARAYLARTPPAVAGQHGDLHTFQACCRVVRGFALDDDQALAVLAEWNARCQPPWTEGELLQKIRSARRNGREPIGGLL